MLKMNKILLSLFLLAACAGSFRAQTTPTAAPAPAAAPAPQKLPPLSAEVIDYFKGNWSGKGKFTSSGKDIESEFVFTPDLDNQCLVAKHTEHPPNTYQYTALWSTDNISGQMVMLLATNRSGGSRLLRSSDNGWQDNKIVFQVVSELRASFALEKITFERISPTSFKTIYQMSRDDGKTWRTGDEQTFVKQ